MKSDRKRIIRIECVQCVCVERNCEIRIKKGGSSNSNKLLVVYDDVIDWDVNQLDKKSNESHDGETDGGCDCDFLELFRVRLGATTNQTHGVAGELFHRVNERDDLIHFDVLGTGLMSLCT